MFYNWATKSASVKTNKQKNQCSEVASTTTQWTRGGNEAQGKKTPWQI